METAGTAARNSFHSSVRRFQHSVTTCWLRSADTSADEPTVHGRNLECVATIHHETTSMVVVDGRALGQVTFATYYDTRVKAFDGHVALWAGATLYVVDRRRDTLRYVARDDETHRIHAFGDVWVIEGELCIQLFARDTLQVFASYGHDEVITDSWLDGELICFRDFQDRTVWLDPSRDLRLVIHRRT
jgi:hypothetical protein